MSLLQVPVSYGELLDKIAILEIKSERMTDEAKLANVRDELELLERAWRAHPAARADVAAERAALKQVNAVLWDIDDRISRKEQAQAFDEEFIALARAVYVRNDERAAIKRTLNLKLGSRLVEEKSYSPYR